MIERAGIQGEAVTKDVKRMRRQNAGHKVANWERQDNDEVGRKEDYTTAYGLAFGFRDRHHSICKTYWAGNGSTVISVG